MTKNRCEKSETNIGMGGWEKIEKWSLAARKRRVRPRGEGRRIEPEALEEATEFRTLTESESKNAISNSQGGGGRGTAGWR